MKRFLVAFMVFLTACGGSNIQPRLESSLEAIGVGPQRVLITLFDVDQNQYVATAERSVTATLRDSNGAPLQTSEGEFVWREERGTYAFRFDLPEPERFQVTLETEEFGVVGPIGMTALANPRVVSVGEAAPRSQTRTAPPQSIALISSDPNPEPSFYAQSVAAAISGGPTVVVFGSPRWCASSACVAMVDQLKRLHGDFPELNFVHVEVYETIDVTSPDQLVFVDAVAEWDLISEPVLFVVDGEGLVAAVFEGGASDDELREAFEGVRP